MDQTDHYNRGGLIALLGAFGFVVLFFIYLAFLHPGVVTQQKAMEQGQAADQTQSQGTTGK